MAALTYLSPNTVKSYIRTIYRKIDVASRTQAVLWGAAHGFTPTATASPPGAPRCDPQLSGCRDRKAGAADDQGGRLALLSVLAHASRDDRAPIVSRVRVLDHLFSAGDRWDRRQRQGTQPGPEEHRSAETTRAYEDWRTELFGLARAEI